MAEQQNPFHQAIRLLWKSPTFMNQMPQGFGYDPPTMPDGRPKPIIRSDTPPIIPPLTPQTPPTRDPLPMSAPSPVQMGPSPWLRRSPQHPMTGWMAHGDRYQHQAPSAQTPPIVQPPTTETPPIYDPKSMTPKMSR